MTDKTLAKWLAVYALLEASGNAPQRDKTGAWSSGFESHPEFRHLNNINDKLARLGLYNGRLHKNNCELLAASFAKSFCRKNKS